MGNLEIAKLCMQSGADCGSIFIDLRFRELVKVSNDCTLSGLVFQLTSIDHIDAPERSPGPSRLGISILFW
jgi:hypothetical protein